MSFIDLRSDTVTRPTAPMREAMLSSPVGDDVYGEDPTVHALEERMAALLGHEAGLFCPSGTMANQLAVQVHARPGDEVICDEGAHIYRYEGGGLMANSGCSVRLLRGDRGRFTAAQVEEAIGNPADIHQATSRLVSIEDSSNRGGGSVWNATEIAAIRAVADRHGLAMHLDGARLFNALAVTGERPSDRGALFDTASLCLSKGLGAPVGSVLTGSRALIGQARRARKRMGGGMRQAGMLAAAGLFALDHHVERIAEDHRRAKELGAALASSAYVAQCMPVETNIIIITLDPRLPAPAFLQQLKEREVLAAPFGPQMVRFVTHLDVGDQAIAHVQDALNQPFK